jgi:hypothetical protein
MTKLGYLRVLVYMCQVGIYKGTTVPGWVIYLKKKEGSRVHTLQVLSIFNCLFPHKHTTSPTLPENSALVNPITVFSALDRFRLRRIYTVR